MTVIIWNFVLLVITLVTISEAKIKPNGKAILITGTGKGFGNQLAREFNELGFRVYATDRNIERAQKLKENVTNPNNLVPLKLDVTKDEDVQECFKKVKEDLEKSNHVLWGLINNAGIYEHFPLEWATLEDYRPQFEVNLFGVVRMSRVFMPLLRASKGRLVNIVSLLGRFSVRNMGVYSMAKHALMSFTDVLRQEVSRFGVKVVSIEPGFTKTGMFSEEAMNKNLEKYWNKTPEDVKEAYGGNDDKEKAWVKVLMFFMDEKLDMVVDDVIDSIVSLKPRANYRPRHSIFGLLYYIHQFAPAELWDLFLDTADKVIPLLSFLK